MNKKVYSFIRSYWYSFVFILYVSICFMVEQPRPHAVYPIGSNPHSFTLIPQGAFPKEIPGKVVTLKQLSKEDIPGYHEMFSEQARKMLSFPLNTDDFEWTKKYVEYEIWRTEQREMLYYGIHDNEENRFIGGIDIRSFWRQDPGQVGFWLNEKYYGGGRMKEAVDLLVNAYFYIMDVPVINAYVEPFNKRSFAACKKFGFEFVGFSQKPGKAIYYVLERYR